MNAKAKEILLLTFTCLCLHLVHGEIDINPAENAGGAAVADASSEASHLYSTNEMFDVLDRNHDSKLTLKDFYGMDQNQNGEISKSEFLNSVGGNTGNTFPGEKKMAGFSNAFSSSTAMIIATEIGDKTFFIAAVLSMRHSRLAVFGGGIFALICMTVLSTMMGLILPSVLPRQYTHIIGGILFLYFGVKLIYDSRSMSDKVSDELEEVEEELNVHSTNKKSDEGKDKDDDTDSDTAVSVPMGNNGGASSGSGASSSFSSDRNVLFQSFILTFLAEWGDRSQIATIALAAAKDPYGVTLGACFGHSLCTGMAVIGGRMLASKISEKTVSFWGGCIFLAFALHALFLEE